MHAKKMREPPKPRGRPKKRPLVVKKIICHAGSEDFLDDIVILNFLVTVIFQKHIGNSSWLYPFIHPLSQSR